MPDITMCQNEDCELKEDCYRATAKPSHVQSYAVFEIFNGCCEHYWPAKDAATDRHPVDCGCVNCRVLV